LAGRKVIQITFKKYTGYTADLSSRFEAYQKGRVPSTKSRRPLDLIYFEACLDQKDALKRDYFSFIDYYLPLTRYYGHRKVMFDILFTQDSTQPARIRGYAGQKLQWNKDFDNAKEHYNSIEVKIDENLVKEFDLFLKECELKNIDMVMVYSPEFIMGQKFVSNRNDIMNIYKNISNKY